MKNEDAVRLFDLYSDDLFRFAVSYVGSKHDAEDIVQEVFLKILGKHITIIRSTEKTYLMTITANMCKDHRKRYRLCKLTLRNRGCLMVIETAPVLVCTMSVPASSRLMPLFLFIHLLVRSFQILL